MTIYSAQDRTPYTYLIGWSRFNLWYYGVRYSKKCHPSQLWKTYFTSSKCVEMAREYNGEPDIIEIRRIFKSVKQTLRCEAKILKRINARQNSKWLNISNGSEDFIYKSSTKTIRGKRIKQSRPFIINGKYYNFISEASEEFNLSKSAINGRLNSKYLKWENWYYCDIGKISSIRRKVPHLGEFNKKRRGISLTSNHKKKCSISLKGRIAWNKDKKYSIIKLH